MRKNHSALLEHAPEHLKLIGLVTANWAILEADVCRLLCFMSDLDWPAARALLLTTKSNKMRTDIVWNFAVSQKFSDESLKRLRDCLNAVRNCAERRNEIIHNFYGIGLNGVVMHKSSARRNKDESRPVSEDELLKLAEDIGDCGIELNKLPSIFHPQHLNRRKP
jgi:hypothetical protein